MLTKFEGTFAWNGNGVHGEFAASYDGNVLSLAGLPPSAALEIFNRLAKLGARRGEKPAAGKPPKQKKQAAPKPEPRSVKVQATEQELVQTPPAAEKPTVASNESTNGNGKLHYLPTVVPNDVEAATVAPPLGRIDPPKQDPFLEDLEIHKTVDAAARAQVGSDAVPQELVEADSLKKVILFLHHKHQLTTADEILEACEAWRASVPTLRRIDPAALKKRVANAVEHLGLSNPAN